MRILISLEGSHQCDLAEQWKEGPLSEGPRSCDWYGFYEPKPHYQPGVRGRNDRHWIGILISLEGSHHSQESRQTRSKSSDYGDPPLKLSLAFVNHTSAKK